MALQTDNLIGTGQTYTTVAGWETAINTGVFTGDNRGRMLGESFNESVTFDGATPGPQAHLILMANFGAEHDGRAHKVSGNGNARFEYTGSGRVIEPGDPYQEFCWFEIYGKAQWDGGVRPTSNGINYHNLHHLVIHAEDTSQVDPGIAFDQQSHLHIHRNIVYAITDQDGVAAGNSQNVPNYIL